MMKGFVKGVKGTFTAEGMGALIAIFAVLALAAAFGFGVDRAAAELRARGVGG